MKNQGRLSRYAYDAYPYGLVAAGHVDAVLETDLEPYDFMSNVPIIEQAGGKVTDWSGNRLTLQSKGDVLATATPELHEAVLNQLG